MFSGKFLDQKSFQGDDFAIYESDGLKTAFCGTLYNAAGIKDAQGFARHAAQIYTDKGIEGLSTLDGSFTIVFSDAKRTVVVRDHHGFGEQVYYSDTHYCSSLLQLRDMQSTKTRVDYGSLGMFLSTGYVPTGRSSFLGVWKLAAGSALIHDDNGLHVRNLFDTSDIAPEPFAGEDQRRLDEYAGRYGALHTQAIRRRIGDSRNVGILLSGGYDSGCNLVALRQVYDGDIRSYSIGFKGDNWSELPLARCMSDTFGTIHHEYEIDGSEITALPEIVEMLGDPFVEGGLMVNYAAMRMIGENKPDVILGGDGSDQYFGTSGREVAIHYLARRYGLQPAMTLAYDMLGGLAASGNDRAYRARFHLDKILHILHGDVFGFEQEKVRELFRDPGAIVAPVSPKADVRSFEHLYTQHAYKTDLEKIINQVILFKANRMASMFGNRMAFPYLDLELYDFLKRLPVHYKCKGDSSLQIAKGNSTAKFLLKYHYKPMLPSAITSKKKQGGFAPMPIFFNDVRQRDRLAEFIMHSSLVVDLLRRDTVERFLTEYDREAADKGRWFWYRQNRAIQYFNLLTLAIWWERYVAGKTGIKL